VPHLAQQVHVRIRTVFVRTQRISAWLVVVCQSLVLALPLRFSRWFLGPDRRATTAEDKLRMVWSEICWSRLRIYSWIRSEWTFV